MYTLKAIRRAEAKMDRCPFCGKKPKIVFTDEEGNEKDQSSEEYLEDPWSGLSFWISHPNKDCVISTEWREFSTYLFGYDTPEDAVEDWNRRYHAKTTKPAKE